MGKSKYDLPEWQSAPVRAQISEALRELAQLRVVWQELLEMSGSLDDYHREVIKTKRNELGKVPIDKMSYSRLALGAQGMAEGQLKRLNGWMISLCESEIGLRAMLDASFAWARNFQLIRNDALMLEADRWAMRKGATFHSANPL